MKHSPGEPRLGVNVDHVATVRNARGGTHPSPVKAALLARKGGADGITAHLREDRRHIRDADLEPLKDIGLPLNFEMALTPEMIDLATTLKPHACCLVPERREELTTEGGLDVAGLGQPLNDGIARLRAAGIRVSLFIDPDLRQVEAAALAGADIVEFHTGRLCDIFHGVPSATERVRQHLERDDPRLEPLDWELGNLRSAIRTAHIAGLECHAGHGLDFQTAALLAPIAELVEFNIGHFLIGQAIYEGLEHAVALMKTVMREARG